ncbi:sentrin-specific protease 1-like [Olea europaea subsp. europaea]|uniref:Sentrin-specific protease 1-like n=1 Tax=Olea europaea subsp. europaea TaxID=158383 RepID=A0A8S0RWV1_OLEEU|nr:sentrin-specific protease 1-like [Olea europaea subsp. europaea]
MLVAFQAWIYETFPSLEGIVVTKISRVHPRIVNWMADEQPSTAKLEGPDCFSNPKIVICDLEPLESKMAMPYMNRVQYNKSIQPTSSTESRRRTKRRTEKSVEDVDTSEKSVPSVLPLMDNNIGQAHSSDDDDDFVAPPPRRQEPSARGKSPVVEGPTAAHRSQEEPQSHGAQRDDFLSESESVSTMISNAMDEIIRWSGDRTSEHGVGQKEAPELEIKNIMGLVDLKRLRSFLLLPDMRRKLFKHDDNVVVFEDYEDNVDEVDKPAFMDWFQRGYKSHTLTVFNSAGKSYRDWKILQSIEPYVKVLPALMNTLGISKTDPDYHEPEAKELKVIIDDTLSQQTNGHDYGIFVVLYALYLIRGGRCSISQKFDASKFRMNITTLLYKHRQVYTKKVNHPMTGEAVVIE